MIWLSRSPSWLVITVIVVGQSPQVGPVDADDIDLAPVVVAIFVKIGGEDHPFPIR
jgi:hypothetical protein